MEHKSAFFARASELSAKTEAERGAKAPLGMEGGQASGDGRGLGKDAPANFQNSGAAELA